MNTDHQSFEIYELCVCLHPILDGAGGGLFNVNVLP